jgi:hypothetical protein
MNRLMTLIFLVLTFQFAQAEEPSKVKKGAECECLNEADSPVPMEQSLKNLADKLNLTEAQKPLWETWSQQLLRAHHSKDEFNRTASERRKLPAPERQEKWMASVETHLHAMRESLPALRSLYSSFNDTQRVTFDAEVPFKHGGCGMSSSKATHAQ